MVQLAAWAGILATAAAFLFTMTGCGDGRETEKSNNSVSVKTHR